MLFLTRPNNDFILRISANPLHESNELYNVNDRIDRVIVNTKNIAPQIYDFIDFISTSNLLDWIISTELKIRKVKDSQFKNCKDALRACLETHLSIMKRFNSMLAMAI